MSYGMPLMGVLAIAVLWSPRAPGGRCVVARPAASAVVLVFAALGFAWWDAYPVLQGALLATASPPTARSAYWWWGNLAALAVSAGRSSVRDWRPALRVACPPTRERPGRSLLARRRRGRRWSRSPTPPG